MRCERGDVRARRTLAGVGRWVRGGGAGLGTVEGKDMTDQPHDWSTISDTCTSCGLPIRAAHVPCRPSTADDDEAIREVAEASK